MNMELTKFLRTFKNLISYDKYHSLPVCLLITLTCVCLATIISAALSEKNVDKSLEAFKDVASISLVVIFMIEPGRTVKMLQLIDDEFVVNRDEFVDRKEMWVKFGMLHEKKKEDMKLKLQYISWVVYLMFFGFFFKNFLNQVMGIEARSEENGQTKWPTPYLLPSPEFATTSFFIYTFTLQVLVLFSICIGAHLILTSVTLSTDKLLADFEAMYLLLEYVTNDFPDTSGSNDRKSISRLVYQENDMNFNKKSANLPGDMARIVKCHQIINRNFKICADCSAFVITAAIGIALNESILNTFFILKADTVKKVVSYAFMFVVENMAMFFLYQNGQRILNQNDILRRSLAELQWIDKPHWFRQTVHIMMTRANVDIEMKPYGIYMLNYVSFKDLMKLTFSVVNVLFTTKLRQQ